MIVSHKYKFIFLKTKKTAGTSIEIALSKYCGENDIITPISPEDEKIRKGLGYRGPQNFTVPLLRNSAADLFRRLADGEVKKFYNHMSAKEIKSYVGSYVWNNYYKFCVERNPWDRCISQYYWRHKTEPRPPISDFLGTDAPLSLKERGYSAYTIDGKVVVDKVCKYEKLSQDLEEVRKKVGIPDSLELPMAKSAFRKDRRNYREVISQADRELIENLFKEEILLLDYEW